MKPVERLKPTVSSLRGRKSFSYLAIAKQLSRQGYDVINFGIGQPDVDTPKPIIEEAKKALDTGFTKYTESQGIAELREAVASYLNERFSANVKPSEVIITPGALAAIFLAYLSYVEPGDEVIIVEPSYPPYTELAKLLMAKTIYIPLRWKGADTGFELDIEMLENSITSRTKMIVLNTPHNPTGAIIPPKHLEKLVELVRNRNIILLVDEIYNEFILDNVEFRSAISFDDWRDYLLYVSGFSKTFSMTGWRLGYLAVKEDVATRMANLAVNIWSCATSFAQKAAVIALKSYEVWEYVREMINLFKKRRDVMVSMLSRINGVEVWPSPATFYLFPYFGKLLSMLNIDAEAFAEQLLYKKYVVVIPGTGFPDRAGENFIRFSFAVNVNDIVRGIEKIEQFIEELRAGKS